MVEFTEVEFTENELYLRSQGLKYSSNFAK